MVVGRDTLYIYGGMMEVKDQEITLDDLHCLNLSKLDEWKCLIPVCNIAFQYPNAHDMLLVMVSWIQTDNMVFLFYYNSADFIV